MFVYMYIFISAVLSGHFLRCLNFEHICLCRLNLSLKSPLDGKDGEGVTMVERTASRRYPSIPSYQGEPDVIGRAFISIRNCC